MKLLLQLVVALLVIQWSEACTCPGPLIDYADEYCRKNNTIIAIVKILRSKQLEKRWPVSETATISTKFSTASPTLIPCMTYTTRPHSKGLRLKKRCVAWTTRPTTSPPTEPMKWVTVDAMIKKVYKGEKSVKGKKIKLKSSNRECGVDDMLKPGHGDFILGFKASKEDVRDEVIEVSLCSLFKKEGELRTNYSKETRDFL